MRILMIKALFVILGIVLVAQAVYVLRLSWKHRERGDVSVVLVYSLLRVGAGLAAIAAVGTGWYGALWVTLGLLVSDGLARTLQRRRRRPL